MPRRSSPASPLLTALVALTALAGCVVVDTTGDGGTAVPDGGGEAPEGGDPPAADTGDAARQIERAIFERVNAERRERGLEELGWDDQLAELARGWSGTMAERGSLEHQDGQTMLERAEGFAGVGENIFRATGPAAAGTIHVGWMRSDGHRANVLRDGFDRLGVGVVCEDDGAVWATQRFGSTGGAPPQGDDEVPPEEPIVAEEGEGPRCPGGSGQVQIELDGAG